MHRWSKGSAPTPPPLIYMCYTFQVVHKEGYLLSLTCHFRNKSVTKKFCHIFVLRTNQITSMERGIPMRSPFCKWGRVMPLQGAKTSRHLRWYANSDSNTLSGNFLAPAPVVSSDSLRKDQTSSPPQSACQARCHAAIFFTLSAIPSPFRISNRQMTPSQLPSRTASTKAWA